MSTTLKEHRERAGMSQAQVARSAGLNERTIRLVEQGKRVPKIATARALAAALGITVDELVPPEADSA